MDRSNVELRFELRPARLRLQGSSEPVRGPDLDTVAPAKPTRAAQLLALAIYFGDMLDRGEAKDYADLARLSCVSRERVSQIMKLRWLAPEIQKQILMGRVCVGEAQLARLASLLSWRSQLWQWDKRDSDRSGTSACSKD